MGNRSGQTVRPYDHPGKHDNIPDDFQRKQESTTAFNDERSGPLGIPQLVMLHNMHSAWVLSHVWTVCATDPEEVKVPRQTNGGASGHHRASRLQGQAGHSSSV